MTEQPTTEALLAQLRATHQPADLVDVAACTVAGAKAWHRRIQEQRRDSGRFHPDGRLWDFDDMTPHDQAALVALVGPVVEAALATLDRRRA